jgi:uncharacterized protein (TIGR03086 family)
MSIDLAPATQRLAALVREVRDDQLGGPTPCPAYTVGDLLDHLLGIPAAFIGAARKEPGDVAQPGAAANLPADWRERLPRDLTDLAAAWAEPGAWEGETQVGGIDMPGAACGIVALEEVVVHGWDLARATGQPYAAEEEELRPILEWFATFPPDARSDDGFAAPPPVGDDASLLDRTIAESGRDPAWRPS